MSGPFRRLRAVLPLLILWSAGALAAGDKPAAPEIPPDLPPRYRTWLAEVAPLIAPAEREAFLGLSQDYQRDAFIRRFWQVRDPYPQTARNEFAERWEERVPLVRDRFDDPADERARVLLLLGAPSRTFEARCPEVLVPLELWQYTEISGVKGGFTLVFHRPGGAGRFRLWIPGDGLRRLLAFEFRVDQAASDGALLRAIVGECMRGDEIAGQLLSAADWRQIEPQVVPQPAGEWLRTFLAKSTDLPEGAPALAARMELAFPARRQSRTLVQGVVSVPREAAEVERLGAAAVFSFLLDGEVLRKGELFESFRIKYSLPEGSAAGDTIPLVFERSLRPGAYRLVVRLQDTTSNRYFREERDFEVPAVERAAVAPAPGAGGLTGSAGALPDNPLLAEANAALAAARSTAGATAGGATGRASDTEQSIRILPPPSGLLTGRARVEAIIAGNGIARVRWDLDGKPVMSKSKPPYSVELDLGSDPRLHRLSAVALGSRGEELAADELRLNAGPHRFSLRLVEPQAGRSYRSSLRAQAEVEVPEGEVLERVELFLNEDRVATLYQPPFAQPLVLPQGAALTYVRAVAYLADGNSTEDLVLINAPEYSGAIDVQLVELYTTVVDRRNRPVEGLAREDFTVLEDGSEQRLHRFDRVTDLPIWAGMMIDTSASMAEELAEAVRGALSFFETVIRPKDRAAVVTFNNAPQLAVRFTNAPEVLAGGLAGLEADGGTALYDSLIYTLHYFGGITGKRALIVLTDGVDESSKWAFQDALDYARRSGVALYMVGIDIGTKEADARMKMERLASETGGRHFFIEQASDLKRVYAEVESELRTQYLLAYQSSGEGDKYRAIEVKVKRPGLEARTLRGYYP